MTVTSPDLRLSAQRALLGAVCHGVRLVAVTSDGQVIAFRAIFASDHDPAAQEELSCALTEIVADFADSLCTESYTVNDDPLPNEDIFEAGWVFVRHEPATMMVQ